MASKNPPPEGTIDMKEIGTTNATERDTDSELKHGIDKVQGDAVNDQSVDTDVQTGVQKAEAINIAWTRKALITAYIVIWYVYFVQGLIGGVSSALIPYVTSDFAAHSLIPTTGLLSQIIGGVCNLCFAKILDIFGRPHGFLACAGIATIGLIMSASCNGVEAYAASQIFYNSGINTLGYCLTVFIADTSSLRHRGLIQALLTSPNIITAWLAGPISNAFLKGSGWRWAFGMESILLPCVALPLFALFMFHYKKAKKEGILPARPKSGRTLWQSILYYGNEFDAVGLLLLSAGFSFLLLPFNLYTLEAKGWKSAMVICFLIFGVLFIALFVVWEKYYARVSLTPWNLLRDRTVLGTCMLGFTLFLSLACWNTYLSSYLQVVYDLDVTYASYVVQSGTVISVIGYIVAGATISYTGRYKPISVYLGLPLCVLGEGLLIYFREPTRYLGYVVMCNLFIYFSFGVFMLTVEIGMLAAASKQQYFAIGIALLNLFQYIGTAIGLTISSAIWQGTLPQKLALHLPPEEQGNATVIYGSIEQQLSYEWGSTTRLAIQHAYADTWRLMMITGVAVWVVGLASVLMWKNMNVKGIKQNKGVVV